MSWCNWRGRFPFRSCASTRAARRSRSPKSRAGPRSNMLPPRRFSKRVIRVQNDSSKGLPRYPNLVEHLEVNRPDQVWLADITYVRLRKEHTYLAVLMDVFTRSIRGWHLSRSLEQELTITALRRAFERGRPEIHHSDQGVQYAATAYVLHFPKTLIL